MIWDVKDRRWKMEDIHIDTMWLLLFEQDKDPEVEIAILRCGSTTKTCPVPVTI
jgi:hypothetical protein